MTHLNLSKNQLKTIPHSLSKLQSLKTLRLRNNELEQFPIWL
ncbi:MAG: leucine-rich repeat domain-containing protein, partial [Chloroflexota bacterium]